MRLIDRLRDAKRSGIYDQFNEIDMVSMGFLLDGGDFKLLLDICCDPNLPVVEISEVADYVMEDVDKFLRPQQELKEIIVCGVPPFSTCWMEFEATKGFLRGFGLCGGLLETTDMRTFSMTDRIREADQLRIPESKREIFMKAAWKVSGIFFMLPVNAPIIVPFPYAYACFLLDVDGAALPLTEGRCLMSHVEMEKWAKEAGSPIGWKDGDFAKAISQLTPYLMMSVFGVASSFMSCKNIQLIENQPPRHERRQRDREKKPPFTKYYTLNIEPMKKVLRTEGQIEKVGLKRALGIVRGNYAYYTQEKPLFGKLTGRFWRPAHVRGSKEVGEIKKDYKIKLPPSESE